MGRLFGTDGIRGIANDKITCELALALGRAAAAILSDGIHRPVFVIGMDPRASSDMLAASLAAGACSMGADAILLGVVPTAAVAYLVGRYGADAGVMISASHNSAEFNGIKFFSREGYKLPDEVEERIEAVVLEKKALQMRSGTDCGRLKIAESAIEDYIAHLAASLQGSLEGFSLAIDCANGAASVAAEQLFRGLGVECSMLFDQPDGKNINQGCGSTHLDALRSYVVSHHLDMGIAFDGDADRCLCVDERGEIVDGDFIMAICGLDMLERGALEKETVVGTVMSNLGFLKFCEERGIHFTGTRVGDRYVLEEMVQNGYRFGGEQSGHIIFLDYASTGDGLLTALQLLSALKRKGMTLHEAAGVMQKYPQILENIRISEEGRIRFYIYEEIGESIDREKVRLGDRGRIVVRASGTEPLIRVMAEGEDEVQIREAVDRIADIIRTRLE